VFASTNDSVQFHETILSTFLNRKFNMYSDDDDFDMEKGGDYENFEDDDDDQLGNRYEDELGEGFDRVKPPRMNSKRAAASGGSASLDAIGKKKNTVCDIFSLYGNMDQHKRAEILAKFCKATSGVLICTVILFYIDTQILKLKISPKRSAGLFFAFP
jgi:hypothetical protein